ncbi:hypothetical protein ACLOJK_025697 [Asimina triloba]
MLMPSFNDVVGILGALGFWPLTVYSPIEMYIAQKKVGRWTSRWLGLGILSFTCLIISLATAVGSFAGVFLDFKSYKSPSSPLSKKPVREIGNSKQMTDFFGNSNGPWWKSHREARYQGSTQAPKPTRCVIKPAQFSHMVRDEVLGHVHSGLRRALMTGRCILGEADG